MTDQNDSVRAVRIFGGRQKHYVRDYEPVTFCGEPWVAWIVNPPATDMPECAECRAQIDIRSRSNE